MKPIPPKPRKILITADSVSGAWCYSLELARALQQQQVQVILATMGAALSREQKRDIKELDNVELLESTFKLEWMDDPWQDMPRAGNWLLEIERRTCPDVVHLNSYAHGVLPFRAPQVVVGHSCIASWWKAVKGADAPAEWNRYLDAVKLGLQAADLVITPTRAMLAELQSHYGTFPAKVIYNGRDPARFMPSMKEEFIFSSGQMWDEARNISSLSLVAPELPWSIYIAGEQRCPNGRSIKTKALQFLGRLPTDLLAKWYGRASVYCLPARYEPSGSAVLGAALAGCALVLGNIPSLREIWNGVAIFVSPDDPDELKSVLSQLIYNPVRRKEFASYAQCRAIQLTPHRMASEYLSAYSELMAKNCTSSAPVSSAVAGMNAVKAVA